MQKIALITDSACDLDLNTLKENNINLLPLRIVKQYQTETKEINEKYTKSQAIKKATEMAKKKIESKLNDNEYIIDYKRLNVDENNSKIVLELFYKEKINGIDFSNKKK